MLAELLQQLKRVAVVREGGERLLCELERLLELAQLVGEQRAVEEGLEHVRRKLLHLPTINKETSWTSSYMYIYIYIYTPSNAPLKKASNMCGASCWTYE